MTEAQFRTLMREKGYGDEKTKDYEPNFEVALHTHDSDIMLLVLGGEFTLDWEQGSSTYAAGETCELAAGTLHAERTGESGATVLLSFR